MRIKDKFFISGYIMPPRTEECFQDLKDSGLTHIYIDYTTDENKREEALRFCEKYGMKAIVMCCWSRYDDPSYRSVTKNALKYSCFDGVNGLDEPLVEDFDGGIEKEYEGFKKDFPDKTFYINLVNAGVPQKFVSADENKPYPFMIKRYTEFVNKIEFNKTVSMTVYPLMRDGEKTFLNPAHLTSFRYLSKCAKDTGAELYFFVQTMPFRTTHRKPEEEDIRFQVNCGLSFGAKGVQYFCYRTPDTNWEFNGEQYAMVKINGEKTDIYYSVKTVNGELSKIAEDYLALTYLDTYSIRGELNGLNPSFENFFKEEELPEEITYFYSLHDVVLGTFTKGETERKSGNKPINALFITNYTDPSLKKTNFVEFSIKEVDECFVTVKGEKRKIKAVKGRFSVLLQPGDGALISF